jgi:hypothetical protein
MEEGETGRQSVRPTDSGSGKPFICIFVNGHVAAAGVIIPSRFHSELTKIIMVYLLGTLFIHTFFGHYAM